MSRRDQPLYRDTTDQKLGGVCSGLGRYFDIDTSLVRVAIVVLALIGGGGVLAYLLLWIVLDPAPAGFYETADADLDVRNGIDTQPGSEEANHSPAPAGE